MKPDNNKIGSGNVAAFIGLGSNIEPRRESLERALNLIQNVPGVFSYHASRIYETLAIEMTDQSGPFLNQVARIETSLTPQTLILSLQGIESKMGRTDKGARRARIIDLDLILFENIIIHTPELTVPHARFHERLFVLEPLLELEPLLIHPETGLPLVQYRDRLRADETVQLAHHEDS